MQLPHFKLSAFALFGSLIGSLALVGCVGDAPEGEPPQPASADGRMTACGGAEVMTEEGQVVEPVRYDFDLLTARLAADPALQAASGLSRVTTCDDARRVQDAGLARLDEPAFEPGVPGADVPDNARIKGAHAAATKRGVVSIERGGGHTCTGFMLNQNIVVTAAHCLPGKTGNASFTIKYFDPDTGGKRSVTSTNETLAYRQFPEFAGGIDPEEDVGIIVRSTTWSGTGGGDYLRVFSDMFSQVDVIEAWGAGWDGFETGGLGDLEYVDFDIDWYNGEYAITRGTPAKRICKGDSGGPAIKEVGSTDLVTAVHTSIEYFEDSNGRCSGKGLKQRHTRVNYAKMIWIRQAAGSILGGGDVDCDTDSTGNLEYYQCW